jgi:hypothetical protein
VHVVRERARAVAPVAQREVAMPDHVLLCFKSARSVGLLCVV